MPIWAIVLIVVAVILVLWFVGTFNALIRLKNQVKNSWSQIDVQLKRRHDLIPNLVQTAKGYMKHEKETLENITKARNLAQDAKSVGEAGQAESALGGALSKFFVVVENYPDLKANQNFLSLQEELTSTENKITFARQFYNDSVLNLNNKVESIPANIVAGICNFKKAEFFEIDVPKEKEVPKVSF